jgi:hypothetical protein
MKKSIEFGLCVCLLAIPALGQNATASKSSTTIQCRSLNGSTTPIQADEKVIGDQICKAVPVQKAPTASAETDMTPAQSMPKQDSVPAPSASTSGIEVMPNSVFISPMNGFESYLAAAFSKKQVPLTIVADPARAAYIITGTSDEKKAGVAKMLVFGQIHSDNAASVQMVDQKTSAVVFAYAVNKKNTLHGQQTTAEACAKHLKEQLEKK